MTASRIDIRVASPCTERWEKMEGDELKRFCARCQLHVHNLSAMTLDEVDALVRDTRGRLCGRLYRRLDGTVLTRDCPVGLRRVRARMVQGMTLAAALLGAVFVAMPDMLLGNNLGYSGRVRYWMRHAGELPLVGRLFGQPRDYAMGGMVIEDLQNQGVRASGRPERKSLKDFGHDPED